MRSLASPILVALLLAAILPAVGAQSPPAQGGELSRSDPRGDTGVFGGTPLGQTGSGGGQPTPLTDSVDLVSLRVHGEDQEGLYVEIGVNDAKPPTQQVFEFGNYGIFDTTFRLEGQSANYRLRMQITTTMARNPVGVVPLPSSFCVAESARGGPCSQQRVFANLDWDKSLLTAYISKQALMGHDPVGTGKPPAVPPRIEVGAQLTEFRVFSSGGLFGGLFADTMPNQGQPNIGPYVLQATAANDRLRLRLHNDQADEGPAESFLFGLKVHDFPTATVSPGSTALVQVAVENWNSAKRLINLSAELVDKKDAGKWESRIVPTITVPGGDKRVVNLVVNLTGGAAHLESALLRVTARSLGFADEVGVMKVRLVAAVPPSPSAKDIYFHIGGQPVGATTLCFGCPQPSWLNTLQTDSRATSDAGAAFNNQRYSGLSGVEYMRAFTLDAPLNEDVVLDTRSPIIATLAFQSTMPLQGIAKIEISSGDVFIAAGEAPWNGQGSAQITTQPVLEAERLPTGSVLTVRVSLASTQPSPGAFVGLEQLRPSFIPKDSKLSLPIVPDPKPRLRSVIPAGPAFLTLNLDGDAEQMVNPGKVRVFKLTIINEGVQEDVVSIDAIKDSEDWYVGIKPSDTYRLRPGESASFGVLVKAPSDAQEGAQGSILINATSRADPSALAQASLTAIVTTGVEFEDEADNFTADDDTISRVEEVRSKKSPGPGFVGLAAALAGLGLLRRRRSA